jgi:hypothetical protein
MLEVWNDLKSNVSRAKQILSQETLTYDDVDEIVVLRGKIQDGSAQIKSIDFAASSKNLSNQTLANSIAQAMLATAAKADGILVQFQEPVYQNNENKKVAAATGAASAVAIAFGYSILPKAKLYAQSPAPSTLLEGHKGAARALVPFVAKSWTPYLLGAAAIALVLGAVHHYRTRETT